MAIRRRVGYLPGGIAFYDGLTGERCSTTSPSCPVGRRPPRRPDRAAGAVGADPPPAGPRLLARDAPEDRHHPGAPARPGAGDPRRADRGPRPAHAARVLRHPRRAAAPPAGRSSSRRTCCPRSSGSATAWRSSGAGGWSRSRRSRRCSRGGSATWRCGSPARRPSLDGVAGVSDVRVGGRPADVPARGRRRARSWRPSPARRSRT